MPKVSAIRRVLIVEDRAEIRRLIRRAARHRLDIVGELADGRGCVSAARTQANVVIMDCDMPFVGGDEATRRVKLKFPEVAVVGFRTDPDSRARMLVEGADAAFDRVDVLRMVEFVESL